MKESAFKERYNPSKIIFDEALAQIYNLMYSDSFPRYDSIEKNSTTGKPYAN